MPVVSLGGEIVIGIVMLAGLRMAEQLHYESGIDRAKQVRARRRRLWWKVPLIVGCVMMALLVILAAYILYAVSNEGIVQIQVTVVNATSEPIDDLGFDDYFSARVMSFGPLAVAQTKTITRKYSENELATGFSFDQAGTTRYARLGENQLSDDDSCTLTIASKQITATFKQKRGGATTTYVETPSTQPIPYLDDKGKPLPVFGH